LCADHRFTGRRFPRTGVQAPVSMRSSIVGLKHLIDKTPALLGRNERD
jgi:hypothetical protein